MALTCGDAALTHPLERVVCRSSLPRTPRPSWCHGAPRTCLRGTGWARAFS